MIKKTSIFPHLIEEQMIKKLAHSVKTTFLLNLQSGYLKIDAYLLDLVSHDF